jgi:biotin carboxyl carrier protein
VSHLAPDSVLLRRNSETWAIAYYFEPGSMSVALHGKTYRLEVPPDLRPEGSLGANPSGLAGLTSPMPGTVVRVAVAPGQRVGSHDPLIIVEAMKMEHIVRAPYAGTVGRVHFQAGDMVKAGAIVVDLEPA